MQTSDKTEQTMPESDIALVCEAWRPTRGPPTARRAAPDRTSPARAKPAATSLAPRTAGCPRRETLSQATAPACLEVVMDRTEPTEAERAIERTATEAAWLETVSSVRAPDHLKRADRIVRRRKRIAEARARAEHRRVLCRQSEALWGKRRGLASRLSPSRFTWAALPSIEARPLTSGVVVSIVAMSLGFSASTLVAPAATDTIVGGAINLVAPLDPDTVARLDAARDCARRLPVLDVGGAVLAHVPARDGCGAPGDATAAIWAPSLLTADLPADQATRFTEVIDLVEGRSTGSGTFLGLNLTGLLRAAASVVLPGQRVGGSSGWMSGIEVLQDLQGEDLSIRLKLSQVVLAMRYTASAAHDPSERDRFVAETLPAAVWMGGPENGLAVAGGLLAEAVFGKASFSELGIGELCLLAAAIKRQILLPAADARPGARDFAEARLAYIKGRAVDRCVDPMAEAGRLTPPEAEEARAAIVAYNLPAPRETLPSGLSLLLADADALAPRQGVPVRLWVSAEGQESLARTVDDMRAAWDAGLSSDLCAHNCAPGQPRLDVLTVAVRADIEGLPIVAAFQSRHGLMTGPIRGGERQVPHRAIASVVKALVAPLMTPLDTICRRPFANLTDRGWEGRPCADPAAWVSPEDMMARSSNLAFAEALGRIGTRHAAAFLESLGATLGPAPSEERLRRDLATGLAVQIAPDRLIRAFAAIVAGAERRAPSAAGPVLRQGDIAEPLNLDPAHFVDLGQLRALLAAPIADPRGTLHGLAAPLATMGCSGEAFGKTGTSEAVGPSGTETRDLPQLFHVTCGDAAYVIFTLVGSPEIDRPLTGVARADVERLALATLAAARTTERADLPAPVIRDIAEGEPQ